MYNKSVPALHFQAANHGGHKIDMATLERKLNISQSGAASRSWAAREFHLHAKISNNAILIRIIRIFFVLIVGLFVSDKLAFGATEYVTLVKVFQDDDKGIIQRLNGERWMIEKGVGAISFWRYEGKKVLIESPGLFAGVGSRVILPNDAQEARIWNVERLSEDAGPGIESQPKLGTGDATETAQAVALALVSLKYLDPAANDPLKKDPVRALKRFQADNKLDENEGIGPRTLAKLAELVLQEQADNPEGLSLAQSLVQSAMRIKARSAVVPPAVSASQEAKETFIIDVSSDGSIVKLADGSIYEVDVIGQIKTMLWLPSQKVMKQPGGLLNINKAQSVKATVLK